MSRIVFAIILILSVFLTISSCRNHSGENGTMNQNTEEMFLKKRNEMVEKHIIARGISDSTVLAAVRNVGRHNFVPENLRSFAYDDRPLPIGFDQTISQPYIVAFMTQALKLTGIETVLEIGAGSGYQAAVLAEIVKEVYTIEIIKPLAEKAEKNLLQNGYSNVHVRHGDGYEGWPERAPFDAIILTAAPPYAPTTLIQQLAEGGRMIVPEGKWSQQLILYKKVDGRVLRERLIPVRFVPMTGKVQQSQSK